MNQSIDQNKEARLQAAAEQAERLRQPASGDAALDRHRLVLRALRREPTEQLPADFAARVAARVARTEEKGSIEDWLMTLLMFTLGVSGLFYIQPVVASVMQRLHVELPDLPWPWLVATLAGVGVAWLVDHGASRFEERHTAADQSSRSLQQDQRSQAEEGQEADHVGEGGQHDAAGERRDRCSSGAASAAPARPPARR